MLGSVSNRVTESRPLRAVKLRANEYAYNYTMRGVCAFFASTPAAMVTLVRNIILSAALVNISIRLSFTICSYYSFNFAIVCLNIRSEMMASPY